MFGLILPVLPTPVWFLGGQYICLSRVAVILICASCPGTSAVVLILNSCLDHCAIFLILARCLGSGTEVLILNSCLNFGAVALPRSWCISYYSC